MELNNLIATKADKGNTLIIMHKDEYDQKIEEFIATNNFTKLTKDKTKQQHKAIRTTVNTCNSIIKLSEN
jgi:hypothetical protein